MFLNKLHVIITKKSKCCNCRDILLIYIHIVLSLFSIKSTVECMLHFNDTGLQALYQLCTERL